MADERLLAGLRRYWTKEQVETAYQAVLTAYASGVAEQTVIIGTSFDGQTTNAQVTLDREAMRDLLDVYEERLLEIEEVETGTPSLIGNAPSVDFSARYVGT